MGKFAQIAKGKRATKPVTCDALDGTEFSCHVRLLDGGDDDEILTKAAAHAAERKVAAKDGEPVYLYAIALYTVLHACVDPEDGKPFFASLAEIREHLDADRVQYLYEQQRTHQEECAPAGRRRGLSEEEWMQQVAAHAQGAVAGDGELPFERWPLALRRSFISSMAAALLIALGLKSSPTSSSDGSSTGATPH